MFKLLLSFTTTVILFIIFSASSCSNKNVKDTTFITSIPTPYILHLENNGNSLAVTVDQHYNKSTHEDLQEIIILSDTVNSNFESFSNSSLTSLANITNIPLYRGSSAKLVLSGNTFSANVDIGGSGLVVGNSYSLAAVTRGSNEFYAKAFEHNGWFFSKRSDNVDVYISSRNSITLDNFYFITGGGAAGQSFGFTVQGTAPVLNNACAAAPFPATPSASTCDLVLSLKNNNGFKIHVTVPCAGNAANRGIYSYLLADNQQSLNRPNENNASYLCDVEFPANAERGFMARTANFYFRIHIDSVTGTTTTQNSDVKTKISVFIQPIASRLFF